MDIHVAIRKFETSRKLELHVFLILYLVIRNLHNLVKILGPNMTSSTLKYAGFTMYVHVTLKLTQLKNG